jgi:hypothetical protein
VKAGKRKRGKTPLFQLQDIKESCEEYTAPSECAEVPENNSVDVTSNSPKMQPQDIDIKQNSYVAGGSMEIEEPIGFVDSNNPTTPTTTQPKQLKKLYPPHHLPPLQPIHRMNQSLLSQRSQPKWQEK